MLGKFVAAFDQFGQQVKLSINSHDEFKTTTGGIMTILAIGLTMIMAAGSVSNYLKHEEPAIAFEYDYTPDPGLSPLNSSNYLFSITAQDSDFNISASYLGFNLFQTTIARYPNGSSTKVKTRIPLQRCPLEYWAGFEDDYYLYNISNRLCPTVMDYNITGSYLSVVYTYLSIEVVGCQNRTDQPDIVCLPQETLDAKVPGKEITLSYMYTDNMFNLNDWTNPVKRYVTNLHWVLAPKLLTKETDIFLQQYDIITDDNYFLNGYWVKNESTYQINGVERDQNYAPVKSGGNDVYMKIYLRKSSSSTIATRTFSKAADILSTIGGLAGFLFMLFGVIAIIYNKILYQVTISNALYEFDIPVPPKKNDKNSKRGCCPKRRKTTVLPSSASPEKSQGASDRINRLQLYIKSFDKYTKGQERKLKFNFFDFIMGVLSCWRRKKDRLIAKASEKIEQDTDIIQILKRLQELEKLKEFFFDPNQREIFSYSPPPLITTEIILDKSVARSLSAASPGPKTPNAGKQRRKSILARNSNQPDVADVGVFGKFSSLFDAYQKVRRQKTKMNKQLLALLDAEMEETLYNLDYELKIDLEFSKQYYKIIGLRAFEDLLKKAQKKNKKMTKTEAADLIARRWLMKYKSRMKTKELEKIKSLQQLDETRVDRNSQQNHELDIKAKNTQGNSNGNDDENEVSDIYERIQDEKDESTTPHKDRSASPFNQDLSFQLKAQTDELTPTARSFGAANKDPPPDDLEAQDNSRLELISTHQDASSYLTFSRGSRIPNFVISKPVVVGSSKKSKLSGL